MSELSTQLLTLLITLIGLGIVLSVLFGGSEGPKKFLRCLFWPFKALGRLVFALLLFLILAALLMQSMPDWRQRISTFIENLGSPSTGSPDAPAPATGQEHGLTWPLPISHQAITQKFGSTWSVNASKRHAGIDITASAGTEVYAVAGGRVTRAGTLVSGPETSTWGDYVIVGHDDDRWTTSYLHIDINPKLPRDRGIPQGQLLGWVHHDHLHFGIRQAATNDLSPRGALPKISQPGGDPAFPEKFVDPTGYEYGHRQ